MQIDWGLGFKEKIVGFLTRPEKLGIQMVEVVQLLGYQLQSGPEKESEILSFEQFVTFLINGTRSSKMDEQLSRKFHHNLVLNQNRVYQFSKNLH